MKAQLPLLIFLYAIISTGQLFGQVEQQIFVVTGKITDGYGNAIPGANIVIKGTTIGTVSDAEGKYKIELTKSDQVLVVSYVGFASVERKIKFENKSMIIANFSIGTEEIERFGWCCTDHSQTGGPHCGNSQVKLTEKFGCKTFKRDN